MLKFLDIVENKWYEFPSWKYIRDNGGLSSLVGRDTLSNLYRKEAIEERFRWDHKMTVQESLKLEGILKKINSYDTR